MNTQRRLIGSAQRRADIAPMNSRISCSRRLGLSRQSLRLWGLFILVTTLTVPPAYADSGDLFSGRLHHESIDTMVQRAIEPPVPFGPNPG